MTEIFYIIFFTSMWVLGLTIVTQEGMLLYSVRKWASFHAQEEGPSFFHAVILCPWCMPSLHSVFGYLFCILSGIISATDGKLWLLYPIVICASSLTCGVIWTIYETILTYKEKIEVEKKHLDHVEQLSFFDVLDRKKEHQRKENNNSKNKTFHHER